MTTEELQLIRFLCPHCAKRNKAPLESDGFGGTCPRCGGGVEVPDLKHVQKARTSGSRPAIPHPLLNVILHPVRREVPSAAEALPRSGDRVISAEETMIPAESASPEDHLQELAALATQSRSKAKQRVLFGTPIPWWVMSFAHIAMPVLTAFAIWLLYQHGYLPGLRQYFLK